MIKYLHCYQSINYADVTDVLKLRDLVNKVQR